MADLSRVDATESEAGRMTIDLDIQEEEILRSHLAGVLDQIRDLIAARPGHERATAIAILLYAGYSLEKNGECAGCILRGGLERAGAVHSKPAEQPS